MFCISSAPKPFKKILFNQYGQALAETLLVFPILLIFFIGFIGTGTLLLHKVKLAMAVREAALMVSQGKSTYEVETWLKNNVCGGALGLKPEGLTLRVERAVSPGKFPGELLKFAEFVAGDLSGRRVEIVYKENLPRSWEKLLGFNLVLKEYCVILQQHFLLRRKS